MRLKTAPRVLLGFVVVGALAYGVNYYIDHRPKPAPVDPAQAPVPQAVQEAVQPVVAPVVIAPQPVQAAPVQPQPQAPVATQQDRAIDALTGARK